MPIRVITSRKKASETRERFTLRLLRRVSP
jgi:hypothetical protein